VHEENYKNRATTDAAARGMKNGWRMVKFGDVVECTNLVERDALAAGLERYVGLEHIEPESLHIKSWGLVKDGTSFTRKFVKGQVLFGKRRAYQRKVAVAEFDGICSSDILTLQPKDDELIPELLPFIVQSDGFFDHALGTSAGSLSPRTKWSQLKEYAFPLPPKDEQRRIADILWAADEAADKYRDAQVGLEQTMVVFRDETFGRNKWPKRPLHELFDVQLGKMLSPKSKSGTCPKPYLANANVQWGYFDLSSISTMDFDAAEFEKFRLRPGELIVCEGGEVGRSAMWRGEIECCCYQKALHRLRPVSECMTADLMLEFMNWAAKKGLFASLTGHSTIAHLTAVKLKALSVPVPPKREQECVLVSFHALRSAIEELQTHLHVLSGLKNALLTMTWGKRP